MTKKNNFIKNLKILDGTITYDGFNIDEDKPFEDQSYAFTEDILQINYGERFTLDVGWFPESNPEGFFVVRAILDYDWENPLSKIKCRTISELKEGIEKTATLIVKEKKLLLNKNEVVFKLNAIESIKFNLSKSVNSLNDTDKAVIEFYHSNDIYVLGIDLVKTEAAKLYNLLSEAIDNKAALHKSIKKDIGYLWNEKCQGKRRLSHFKEGNVRYWFGLNNLLFSAKDSLRPILMTWIYNNSNGDIILEITPQYPWHFTDPQEGEKFIEYQEWIKTYKPLILSIIPQDIAIIWKNQALEIWNQIKNNEKQ